MEAGALTDGKEPQDMSPRMGFDRSVGSWESTDWGWICITVFTTQGNHLLGITDALLADDWPITAYKLTLAVVLNHGMQGNVGSGQDHVSSCAGSATLGVDPMATRELKAFSKEGFKSH